MNDTLLIILYSSAAGLPIFIGGLISSLFQAHNTVLKDEINHWIVAFGGGALMSAIAFALIPKALHELPSGLIIVVFLAGTFSFMGLDMLSTRIGGSIAQVVSMMMDFIPEALALGASFAYDHKFGLLLAIFIGLQNLPEGFNSYVELREKMRRRSVLALLLALSTVGIVASLTGEMLLKDNLKVIHSIMLLAGGGILYLIFQDIAPMSKRKNDWVPATGACVGFLIGMLGDKIL
ncbi:ZIP family metal transporter [Marispirochaeta aestuarii]|nr:divalent cation transporter [Marispirochaeta aestuarii]